jgi:phage-related protein (TIGR01555 family)
MIKKKEPMRIGARLRTWVRGMLHDGDAAPAQVERYRPPDMMPGVVPEADKLAMDDAISDAYRYANQSMGCIEAFPGYPVLAQWTQIAEYRMLSEKTAMAMTRKWIELRSTGDGDKSERMAEIESELRRLNVRELFGEAAKLDGFFGRGQLFIDLGDQAGPVLENPLFMSGATLKGKLRKFKIIEPMYTYPNAYSATNPMADDYYAPRTWFVMGQRVHASRLLTFVGRPVPDMLKPSYNFGGISMSQLAKPYVDNWIKTRTSVNKIISNFSTSGIKTNMDSVLSGGEGEDLLARAQLYTEMRDNQALMMLDNETEEFFQFNVPLTTLDALQAQAQEHMASVSSMPLSILLGVTPTGLNASTDGELRTFYDHVHDMQEITFRANLKTVIDIIQLSKWGDVDPEIDFDFVSMWEADETEIAGNRKADAETAAIYLADGVISAEEVRQKLASDEDSGYNGLDMSVQIEPPEDDTPLPDDDE